MGRQPAASIPADTTTKGEKTALNNGFEYKEQIDNQANGSTVLTYLSRKYRHSSRADWQERLTGGEIFVDGGQVVSDVFLKSGQWLIWRRPPWDEPEVPLFFDVLHEDRELLAVAKPCGLPTVPAGGFLEHTLLALVRKDYPETSPIHRLGRGTSGVVLFARTAAARSSLCGAVRRCEMRKTYRALAEGIPSKGHFEIEVPIGPVPHPKVGSVHAACPNGRFALSRVSVLAHKDGNSILEVEIETGRPHQIRIHLAAVGYPLVGDPLYAAGGGIRSFDALPGDLGYLLHAQSLCLRHPATGAGLTVSSIPPRELRLDGEGD